MESRSSVDVVKDLLKDAQRDIEATPRLIERELSVLHKALSHLDISLEGRLNAISKVSEQLNHRLGATSIQHNLEHHPHSIRAFTLAQNNRASETIPLIPTRARRSKVFSWKWRMFRLPIGTLSIETSQEVEDELRKQEGLNRIYYVNITFLPTSWIADTIVRVSYAVLFKGHSIPFWQRIHSGAFSLVPSAITSALEEGDLLEAGRLLCQTCPADLNHLANSLQQKTIAGYSLRVTGHGHNPSYELRSINSEKLVYAL